MNLVQTHFEYTDMKILKKNEKGAIKIFNKRQFGDFISNRKIDSKLRNSFTEKEFCDFS